MASSDSETYSSSHRRRYHGRVGEQAPERPPLGTCTADRARAGSRRPLATAPDSPRRQRQFTREPVCQLTANVEHRLLRPRGRRKSDLRRLERLHARRRADRARAENESGGPHAVCVQLEIGSVAVVAGGRERESGRAVSGGVGRTVSLTASCKSLHLRPQPARRAASRPRREAQLIAAVTGSAYACHARVGRSRPPPPHARIRYRRVACTCVSCVDPMAQPRAVRDDLPNAGELAVVLAPLRSSSAVNTRSLRQPCDGCAPCALP